MNLDECSKAQPSGKTYAQYRANFDDFNTRNVACELFTEVNKKQSRLRIAEEWNYCKLGKKITGKYPYPFLVEFLVDFSRI